MCKIKSDYYLLCGHVAIKQDVYNSFQLLLYLLCAINFNSITILTIQSSLHPIFLYCIMLEHACLKLRECTYFQI